MMGTTANRIKDELTVKVVGDKIHTTRVQTEEYDAMDYLTQIKQVESSISGVKDNIKLSETELVTMKAIQKQVEDIREKELKESKKERLTRHIDT